jgi:hypothetical protein
MVERINDCDEKNCVKMFKIQTKKRLSQNSMRQPFLVVFALHEQYTGYKFEEKFENTIFGL